MPALYDGFAAGRSLAVLGNCYVMGVSNIQKGHPEVNASQLRLTH